MTNTKLKKQWLEYYQSSPAQLRKMSKVDGLISAFNANIDAVIKVSGKDIEALIRTNDMEPDSILAEGKKNIKTKADVIRGLVKCFKSGIADEWLIHEKSVFEWLNATIGYDNLQMGGQGGIVANAMAVCGVNSVYVHTASSPKEQSKCFLDLDNLKNVNRFGELQKAHTINRTEDVPLIHWIFEFDVDDTLTVNGESFTCPKSNRFIATYDPLNLKLAIDNAFDQKMREPSTSFEYIILSGYQMLSKDLPDGSSGIERINESIKTVNNWRKNNPDSILHFEIASTQDKTIRKYLLDKLAKEVDSIGFNERELIDILEVIGEVNHAEQCDKDTGSRNLFRGMLKVFDYTNCPRIQLHMFGLYVTLQRKGYRISPIQNRKGMQLAANIAATKAGTGAINSRDDLLWSANEQVSDIGLNELRSLSGTVSEIFESNNLVEEGIFTNDDLEIIAVPTIIIDKPITLVGMGDTISSISLVGAR